MDESNEMMKWITDLFPVNRSLTGQGVDFTINYFKKINPEFSVINFKSGKKVFDWIIPKVWIINDAYIKHESGKKYAEFKKNNLHLVGYSSAVNKVMPKNELLSKIHTLKNQPNLIPYVTNYYKKDWGFCLSADEKNTLPDGNYKAFIDSKFINGSLKVAEARIKGRKKDEIFFSTYFCHPSMANDNLSGLVILNSIMKYLKKFKSLNYSYRFVMLPETIGSIAYLSKKHLTLKRNIICGFNLSCLGNDGEYSFVKTPHGNKLCDEVMEASLINKKTKIFNFINRGSDERQYCHPKIDLPVCNFSKKKFHEFPEYHTSADNLKFISKRGLGESLQILKNIVNFFEIGAIPENKIFCEPFFLKYNKSDSVSIKNRLNNSRKISSDIISYSDGKQNIFKICKIIGKSLDQVFPDYNDLIKKKILKTKFL